MFTLYNIFSQILERRVFLAVVLALIVKIAFLSTGDN
jgi:hypothetical protein